MLFRLLKSFMLSAEGRAGFPGLVTRRKSLGNMVSLLDRSRTVLLWDALLLILLTESWELFPVVDLIFRRDGLGGA